MATSMWGNFIILIVLFADTFAIYFLIKKVKALETLEQQDTIKINYIAEKQEDLETLIDQSKRARQIANKRMKEIETKYKALIDED